MTAPGDDGDADSDRESTTGEPDASPPPATDPETSENRVAGSTDADADRSPPARTEADNTDTAVTESDSFSLERHQQEREDRQPPAVGREGRPRSQTTEDESESAWMLFTRDIVVSVVAVALLGMYLFAISGVWPPMVAIESGSMAPNMEVNDLVFLMETERFQPDEAQAGTGVVTAAVGAETGYGNYGGGGDVIVFEPGGDDETTPIIHRAMFWVEEGENWCERADPAHLGSLSTDDDRCIASNDGFITKGDNNNRYDQASLQAQEPIKPEWVVGTAETRIPGLGWFRLRFR